MGGERQAFLFLFYRWGNRGLGVYIFSLPKRQFKAELELASMDVFTVIGSPQATQRKMLSQESKLEQALIEMSSA